VKQLAFDLVAPPAPTLGNFVAGKRNVELLQRLRELSRSAAGERSVYLWGAPASGRSHLLHGTLAEFRRQGLRAAYHEPSSPLPLEAGPLDAAAVDDIGRFDDAGQAAVFTLYNRLRETGGVFLAAGDAPPGALRLRADLSTRIAWGLVYEVHALSDREKIDALTQYAQARGFGLQADVAEYLLNRVRRDMRTLIATIDALDRYGLQAKRSVTVPLLRQMLNDHGAALASEKALSLGVDSQS
jgi:DnaA family protein